jgi:sulfite reductase beta subunit-like hemoprotein
VETTAQNFKVDEVVADKVYQLRDNLGLVTASARPRSSRSKQIACRVGRTACGSGYPSSISFAARTS